MRDKKVNGVTLVLETRVALNGDPVLSLPTYQTQTVCAGEYEFVPPLLPARLFLVRSILEQKNLVCHVMKTVRFVVHDSGH